MAVGRIKNAEVSVMKILHGAARQLFEKSGYRWEVRRTGEQRIGLWRLSISGKGTRKKGLKKRFVVVPGFGDSPFSWFPTLMLLKPVLQRKYDEVVLLDLPGFAGILSEEKCYTDIDLLFSGVGDVLDGLKPHTLMGHSLGGWIVGEYLASCGEGVRPKTRTGHYRGPETGLIISASGVFGESPEKEQMRQMFEAAAELGIQPLRAHLFASEPIWFRLLADQFGKFIQREDAIEFIRSVSEEHDVAKHLSHVRAKTWIIWGDKDTLCPAKWAREWLKALGPDAGAQAVMLKGLGHSLQIESPARLAAVIGQIVLDREPHQFGKRWWTLIRAGAGDSSSSLSAAR